MSRVTKEASRDAAAYAKSQRYYGRNAGIRRGDIFSAVNYKMDTIPGYEAAFAKEYKNVRVPSNRGGMGPFVAAAVITIAVAHTTGYDKKVIAYTKRKSGDVRAWLKRNL